MYLRRLPFDGAYTIYAACDRRGEARLATFLAGLGSNLTRDGDAMLALLERTAITGPPRNTEICHKIEGEIWEFIKGRLRVFWFYDEGKVVVCTHGIVKKQQKTPKRDREAALRTRNAYFLAKEQRQLHIQEDEP